MYKRDLDLLLAKGERIQSILLYGEECFLLDYYGKKVASTWLDGNCQKHSFYFGQYQFEEALACFSQGSLFGEQNLVWIKTEKKIPKKQLDALQNALQKNQNGALIVEFYKSESKSSREYGFDFGSMIPSFKQSNSHSVRFFAPTFYEGMKIMREFANGASLQISDFVLQKIFEQQHFDLGLGVCELQKYCVFDGEITLDLVNEIGYGLGSVEFESILDLLLQKRDYRQALLQFIQKGYEEVALIARLQKYFLDLFFYYCHIKIHGHTHFEEALGYKPPKAILEKKIAQCILIKEEQYAAIFYDLAKWREESIKGLSKEQGFLSILIKIQAILK